MLHSPTCESIDYLIIGHITQDVVPGGFSLGGTVSYASLTAKAFGLRVGVVTSCKQDLKIKGLEDIQVIASPSKDTTTFENIYTPEGRIQILHHRANTITPEMVPDCWRNTPVVHFGPVAREIDDKLISTFPDSFIGITPQGWLRKWDAKGHVSYREWQEDEHVLSRASAVVMSIEDVQNDENRVERFLAHSKILVITEGAAGARLYWNGDLRYFKPPPEKEIDPVGAGDIFATAFFIRLHATKDPWEAARFATLLAANSVTRKGISGVPTPEEVTEAQVEILADYHKQ